MSALEQTEWDEEAAANVQIYPTICLRDPLVFRWFIVVALFFYSTSDNREDYLQNIISVFLLMSIAIRFVNYNRLPVQSPWAFLACAIASGAQNKDERR